MKFICVYLVGTVALFAAVVLAQPNLSNNTSTTSNNTRPTRSNSTQTPPNTAQPVTNGSTTPTPPPTPPSRNNTGQTPNNPNRQPPNNNRPNNNGNQSPNNGGQPNNNRPNNNQPNNNQPQQPNNQPVISRPKPPPTPAPVDPRIKKDIFQQVSTSPFHNVLTHLIRYANMTESIKNLRDVTFFAPTDEGFHLTLRDLRYKREGDATAVSEFWVVLLEDQKELLDVRKLLLYHALRGRRTFAQLTPTGIRTAELRRRTEANIDVEFESDGLKDRAAKMPNPNYTNPLNIGATNGIIHSLDRVLIPVDFNRDALATRTQALANKFNPSNKKPVCFPASATVHTANGRIRMRDLQAGTSIRVSEHTTALHSRVFLFSHRRTTGKYTFVKLTTQSGHSITLSHMHYLYSNNKLTAAGAVSIGDKLRTVSGTSRVVEINDVVEHGVIAPHTVHGDILVDGIVASSYTQAVHPRIAQIILAPIRAVVRLGLSREPLGRLLYDGADSIARYIPSGPEKY